jgi:1-acyl-sn-glycerol-3-phosphate acyltransferase
MTGQIPIKRGDGLAARRALDAAADVLRAGGVFGIYPEGTRSPDGRLYKGRTGVARLALDCHVPGVGGAMIGTREAQPIGKVVPKFFSPITIRFSRPMRFDRYEVRRNEPLALRQITDEIMFEIRELSGQEYTNTYAPKKTADVEVTDDVAPAVVRQSDVRPVPQAASAV